MDTGENGRRSRKDRDERGALPLPIHPDAMYLLTWNNEEKRLEATFGGTLCPKEARRFALDWHAELEHLDGLEFSVLLDYSTVTKLDDQVRPLLDDWRKEAFENGARRVRFHARDEGEARNLAAARVEAVNSGREEYFAYGLAA
jgi:hypothetical protein